MVAETIQKIIPSKGTRLKWLLALTVISTSAWLYSFFGYVDIVVVNETVINNGVTFVMWADLEFKLFMAYGASESADKYSHAALNK